MGAVTNDDGDDVEAAEAPKKIREGGVISFFGLFWDKKAVAWSQKALWGHPRHRIGRGLSKTQSRINFWKQSGIYILYDNGMIPIYCGQAGLGENKFIGNRLRSHVEKSYFRNAWRYFSWFGLSDLPGMDVGWKATDLDIAKRENPDWGFEKPVNANLPQLIKTLEAVTIEGFAPRFNSRGGDLFNATLVRQHVAGENSDGEED
jgi:hypothetical protein